MTAGIYARISLDRHDGEGVARQLADCRELAAARGWTDLTEYVDNDISAFRARRRPEYERLLEDLTAGRINAVVAYHPDRLYRRPADLEAFIDAVQTAGADVATVKAGDVDLSNASGRMIARILGSVSRHESERIGERVSRAKRERAAQGRPAGGGARPFGLTADRTELVPVEADALRAAADRILAGATWASQVDHLNTTGVLSSTGRPWTIGTLRRTITSPHIAGLRAYRGEIVGPAAWPPVLDRGTWEILRAAAAERRRGRPPSDRHLLTGLLACSSCGRTLWANQTRSRAMAYRCSPAQTTTGRGCGRISISAPAAEQYVVDVVAGWLARPSFAAELDAYLAYGDATLAEVDAELERIDRQEITLAQRWADDRMTDEAHDAAQAVLAERRRAAQSRLTGTAPRVGPAVTGVQLAAAWTAAPTPERRALLGIIAATPIPVAPGGPPGSRVPISARLTALRPVWTKEM